MSGRTPGQMKRTRLKASILDDTKPIGRVANKITELMQTIIRSNADSKKIKTAVASLESERRLVEEIDIDRDSPLHAELYSIAQLTEEAMRVIANKDSKVLQPKTEPSTAPKADTKKKTKENEMKKEIKTEEPDPDGEDAKDGCFDVSTHGADDDVKKEEATEGVEVAVVAKTAKKNVAKDNLKKVRSNRTDNGKQKRKVEKEEDHVNADRDSCFDVSVLDYSKEVKEEDGVDEIPQDGVADNEQNGDSDWSGDQYEKESDSDDEEMDDGESETEEAPGTGGVAWKKYARGKQPAEGNIECNVCGMKFKWRGSMIYHRSRAHLADSEQKKFECNVCGKVLAASTSLTRHKETHLDDNDPKLSSVKRRFKCDQCAQTFRSGRNLRAHMNTHLPNDAVEMVKCDECDKAFRCASSLHKHKRTHIEDESLRKPHKCDVCGNAFKEHYNLKMHMKLHTDDENEKRPYACDQCDMRFTQQGNMLRHKKKIHSAKGDLRNGKKVDKSKSRATAKRKPRSDADVSSGDEEEKKELEAEASRGPPTGGESPVAKRARRSCVGKRKVVIEEESDEDDEEKEQKNESGAWSDDDEY